VPILLATGNFWLDAGLLSCDEVYSPIQMVFDNEFLGALKHLCKEFEVTGETLALETILAVGPGGSYVDQSHTAHHFRHELWQPQLWTRSMLGPWLESGSKLDVDLAREVVLDLYRAASLTPQISPALDIEISGVIERARKALVQK
jgi:trimethylamine---corrinoid protein Co-methyltransferase